MKTAIMQPYIFPYIGYFQLIDSVDTFVVYDDVNYIKKGWINRNNILVNGKSHLFSIQLSAVSQNKLINEISIDGDLKWKNDLLKTISLAYAKAPFYLQVFPIIESIILYEESNLAKFLTHSLRKICSHLAIETNIVVSSEIEKNNDLKAQDKIIEICEKLNTTQYINAIGGIELYEKQTFTNHNITLQFIKSNPIKYAQFKNEFIPWLSIVDVMMFNSAAAIKTMLANYELI
jgi:hypothetical protein